MNLKKYLLLGSVALGLGITTSCVGDLDLEPNDPNQTNQANTTQFYLGALAKCYSGMAVSGQNGAGSSDISGLDNGTGCYSRALFMMNVFPTDEAIWIWKDAGVIDLVTNNWDASNGNIYGTYSRLYTHIATCNDFLTMTANASGNDVEQMRAEARALRAMSYYWVVDIFGNGSFATEATGEIKQSSRKDLYDFVEKELCEVAGVSFDEAGFIEDGQSMLPAENHYGRLGRDAALGLLSRLYLNAEVYTGTPQYRKCAQVSDLVISHHNGGFQGSGLADNYLYLFCASNRDYQNGQNGGEILWAIPYEKDMIQSYGGTTFLIAASIANELGMSQTNYGLSSAWKSMHATLQFSNKFENGDARDAMWVKGDQQTKMADLDKDGNEQLETTKYIPENIEFSEWTNGYAVVKFTNLIKGDGQGSPLPKTEFIEKTNEAGKKYYETKFVNGDGNPMTFWAPASFADGYASAFASTDLPMIRLAEMYLNYAESFIMGGTSAADATKARSYANLVRQRAGGKEWASADLTADNILDERCRELYWELTRRSDLVRHHKFTGPNQALWAWKGNVAGGTRISDHYDLMPIPTNTLASDPSFKQNPGY